MGFGVPGVKGILHEHKQRAISGSFLFFGRQTIHATPEQVMQAIEDAGIPIRPGVVVNYDNSTLDGRKQPGRFIDDKSFFALFCDAEIQSIDVSDYEGANIIHDLNTPVPDRLTGQYDFIFDGSCFDNMFNPATGMMNAGRLLRAGGRVLMGEHGSLYPAAYLMYSPEWFHDYFVANRFAYCRPTISIWDDNGGYMDGYVWDPLHRDADGAWQYGYSHIRTHRNVSVGVMAEKGDHSTWDRMPIQTIYRSEEESRQYIEWALAMRDPARQPIRYPDVNPDITDKVLHGTYIGSLWRPRT